MARLAFCLPALPSHAAVHAALAQGLADRGHEVFFAGSRNLAGLSNHHQIAHCELAFNEAELGGAGFLRTLQVTARATEGWCRHGPDTLARLAPDLVIADQAEPGASLAAEAAGLPRTTLAPGLPLNRDEAVPPPFVGWPFKEGAEGRKRNRGGWRVTDALLTLQRRALAKGCRDHGLAHRDRIDDWISQDLDLHQLIPALDFPRELPAASRAVGPLRSNKTDDFEMETPDQTIVFASLGTLSGSKRKLLHAICEACSQMPVTLLLAHAGSFGEGDIARLPDNVCARKFWPQPAVLSRASACITHAGLNTALDSVAAQVPMVAIPLAFEQPATAARLNYHGVAEIVAPRRATAKRIRSALTQVLHDPAYREAIRAPARAIAASGGVSLAASLIEQRLSRISRPDRARQRAL